MANASRLPAALMALLMVAAAGCGSQSSTTQKIVVLTPTHAPGQQGSPAVGKTATTSKVTAKPVSSAPVVTAPGEPGRSWRPVATIAGQPAAWIAQRSGVTLVRFDQQLVHLDLHAGSSEPEGRRWKYGDHIESSEVHRVVAGFNGGFKLSYGSVGFFSNGHTGAALERGLGSIVTYQNGLTQIGAWHEGVPARGVPIASVLQNLHLLVDHGAAAQSVESCVQECWGSTLGGGSEVARSALGIRADGQLVWAAGDSLSPSGIARGLLEAGAARAVELDINPAWVAGYLYVHHPGGPSAAPVVPGQVGISGRLLEPDSRDFFTIVAN